MPKKPAQPKKSNRVSVLDVVDGQEVECFGVVTNVKKGTVYIDFDDGDEGDYPLADVTLVETPKTKLGKGINVPESRISTQGFKHASDPQKAANEAKRHEGLKAIRIENRKKNIAEAAKKTPIEVRKAYLTAKLERLRNDRLDHHYTTEQISVMIKELRIINERPAEWKHGCVRARKTRSAEDKLEAVLAGTGVSPTS